jgi:hypothetical protein
LEGTYGTDLMSPWKTKGLDTIRTFVDFYTIVFETTVGTYNATNAQEIIKLPAICLYGKH